MGQKVNPIGLRLGINKTWASRWYANPRDYARFLHEDLRIRKMIEVLPECDNADIAEIEIIRHPQNITIVIHTARPGVVIGIKGANIEKIGAYVQKKLGKKVQIKIKEVKRAELNACLAAQGIAKQLAGRAAFRKVLKQACSNTMRSGAQGIKIRISGRVGGSDMARTEEVKEGRVPLHTLRADIDYGFAEAQTTYGKIGVKVWIYGGMMFENVQKDDAGTLLKKQKKNHNRNEKSTPAGRR